MPELVLPTTAVHRSFLDAMAEFVADGRGAEDDDSMVGAEIRRFGATWTTESGFAAYVGALLADRLPETPLPPGYVPCTTWWWVDGTDYLGRIGLRHRLTERLLQGGGHVGYDVRPSARRRGHATAMLRAVLPRRPPWASTRFWSPATGTTSRRGRSSGRTAASWRTNGMASCASGSRRDSALRDAREDRGVVPPTDRWLAGCIASGL